MNHLTSRSTAGLLAAAALALPALTTAPAHAGTDSCPNAAIRSQQQTERLPECRALEQVSSIRKGGGEIFVEYPVGYPPRYNVFSSPDGSVVNYISTAPVPGQPSGMNEKSIAAGRATDGWVNAGNDPAALGTNADGAGLIAMSEDGSRSVYEGRRHAFLASGSGPGNFDLYVRDVATGVYSAVTREVPGGGPDGGGVPAVVGGTADFGHVIFEDPTPHTLEAVPTAGYTQVYDYSDGAVRLASVLPDGTPAPFGASGSTAGSGISRDGSLVFFTTGHDSQIYIRVNGTETRAVSASQKAVPDPSPAGGTFWALSADGRTAVFTTTDQLVGTDADTTTDLYTYDTTTGKLTRLTEGVDVGGVVGMADDASIIYFNSGGGLYVLRDGTVSLAGSTGGPAGLPVGPEQTARVSADGSRLVFLSSEKLTDYDNNGVLEVYVYDAHTGQTVCASCRTDGQPPAGEASLPPAANRPVPARDRSASARSVSADGRRVFFSTYDRLVPEDVNSASDAYEYVDGKAYLLSNGRGSDNSFFLQASADGSDVFFSSRERLTFTDRDEMVDIYDARVNGGWTAPAPVAECVQDSCQGTPAVAGAASVAASVVFSGSGDPALAGRPGVRRVSVSRPKVVSGSAGVLRVKVPSAGVVSVSGTSVGRASGEASKAKTLSLRVALTKKARATLKRKHRLVVAVTVRFAPAVGRASSKRLNVTFRQAQSASGKGGR